MTLGETTLTPKEIEILKHIARGEGNRQIALYMYNSIHTIKLYIKNICRKLSVQGRTQAVVKAVQKNIIDVFEDDEIGS